MKITRITHILFIALIIVIVFFNSLNNKFVWDDKFLIINNPYIKDSAYISKIFTSQLYEGNGMHSNFYRPIELLSFMADYYIWKTNPFGYHLTSLLVHIFNSALVYLIILAISLSPCIAFITASLFGIAPAISSIVFYTPARSDLLMALFLFLSLLSFIKFRQKGKSILYAASLVSFALSLICKEMAIVLPLLLALEIFRNPKEGNSLFKILWPYIVTLVLYAFLRITVFNFAKGTNPIIDLSFSSTLPLWVRLLTDFKVIFLYLRILILPLGLHMERFIEPVRSVFQPGILLYITGFIITIKAIKKISNKNNLILFGSLWFLAALLPVLNIYPISVLFGEGWLYIPSIGFFIVLSAIFQDIIKPKLGKIFSGILIALFLVYYAFFTISYGRVWKDSISLFTNVLKYEKMSPFIHLAYNNLGVSYYDKGDFKKAIEFCKRSIQSNPGYAEAYNNMAIAYVTINRPVAAINYFKKAIRLEKNYILAYCHLGHVYNIIGSRARALEFTNLALKKDPNYYKAYYNLGHLYLEKGDRAEAMKFFKLAISVNGIDYEAHYFVAELYMKEGKYELALDEYNKAFKLGLDNADIYNKIGFACIKNHKFQEAEKAFMRSLVLKKDQAEPRNNLGNLYSMFGYFKFGMEEYRNALRVDPKNKGIYDNIIKTKKEWKQSFLRNRKKGMTDILASKNSKILLINPKNVAWCGGTSSGPLGLAYLAAIIKEKGCKVGFVDRAVDGNKDIEAEIERYDVIMISSCTPNINNAWQLAKLAKDRNKIVILGGPHPTALPNESLETGCVDMVVRQEGEATVKELLDGNNLQSIKGISYAKNGKIVHNPDRDYIQNLDSIPFPARHLFNFKRYTSEFHRHTRVENILTSRGCPSSCSFCYKGIFGSKYRVRSPENVLMEWKEVRDMGVKEINIIDDNFSVDKERAIEICDMIVANGLKVDWTAPNGLRVDCISKKLLQAMKRSGCYRISIGAESGSQYILDKMDKRIKLGEIKDAAILAKEAGLELIVFLMLGNLYETQETMRSTIDFAIELDPELAQFTMATPYPGTKLYETVKKEGKLLVTDWEKYGSYEKRAYFEYGELKDGIVERMYNKAYRSYYMRPKVILRYLKTKGPGFFRDLNFLKYIRFLR